MIRFDRVPKPEGFDNAAQRGKEWLGSPPDARAKKRPSCWLDLVPGSTTVRFRDKLAEGFRYLCGYSAMYVPNGEVDHIVSETEDPTRLYDWENYRYADGWINASKKALPANEVLDPFEVRDDWFEIILPSLQLVMTEAVPEELRDRARTMLDRMHLAHDERVLRQRREWYRMYLEGELTSLEALAKKAPLIARAVAKQQRLDAAAPALTSNPHSEDHT
ncbi:MAG: hypothetical protein IPI49_15755 [Myxococcales bacterium]|nr:hypothetical protein [Myxococcales bacterium]